MVTPAVPHPYIAVCGPLAAGKTEVTKRLAQRFGWATCLEDLSANPFFTDYYQDMRRWGFHIVTTFLTRALALQAPLSQRLSANALIQDWHFAEHYEIYGIHVFEEGIIDERERSVCEALHRYLMAHTRQPDLVVVLTATPAVLLSRVTARRRPAELAIPTSYVERLVARYDDFSTHLPAPKIVIDTGVNNVLNDPQSEQDLYENVARLLQPPDKR